MSMPSFQMSQTGKILVGVLLAAAAIFFWVNFFLQSGTPQGTDPSQTLTTEQSASAPGVTPTATPDSADGEGSTDAPSVDVPALEVATRDIVVADLPFLVTEPVDRETATGESAEAQNDATGADRPESNLRATINPFSPVVLPPQPAAQQPPQPAQPVAQPAAPSEPVTDVPVPDAPQPVAADPAPPEPVAAPAPAALAPPSPRTAALPRALPAGTLPSTPSLLRRARSAPQTPPLDEVIGATSGAVRVPEGAEQPQLDTARAEAQAPEPVAGADLAPLGPGASRSGAAAADEGGATAVAADPLAAGVTPLSSYLRDNNVTFTGAVLGPVSVGVFRSAETRNPIVIALGSPLPETDIVLTDLRGQQAQFSRDDAQQILTLNLRR